MSAVLWPLETVLGAKARLIEGPVVLRPPRPSDYAAWAQLRRDSQAFLTPWEPAWAEDELELPVFLAKVRRYRADARESRAHAFFVFRAEDDTLVGGASLRHIRRGAAQCCTLGYWVGERFARRGYTKAAVQALIGFAFGDLDLHRIEASCMPENAPSIGVLQQAGFTLEGRARKYLRINGAWRDHLLFALMQEGVPPLG